MAEHSDQIGAESGDATGEFFSVGTPLHAVRPGYVRRTADEHLYNALLAGEYAQVIAPDRTGKSSLIAATAARLQNKGIRVAILDLEQIAERDGGADAGRWYYSIVYRLLRQLRLKVDLQSWWQDKAILSNRQRLLEFYLEVILQNIQEPVVVFVDGLQCLAKLSVAEHLLASIRAAYNARATDPEFSRLSFVLCGECDPQTLVGDSALSPFTVSRQILLDDFTREDLQLFATELNLPAEDAAVALDQIFEWTSGQPYLTQKLARSVAREKISGDIRGHVDRIALQQLAGRAALHSEPQMSHIHRLITEDPRDHEALLNLYGKLRKGIPVEFDPESRLQRKLMATGLVVRGEDGFLRVRNKVYETVFTAQWANQNLPIHWRWPAIAAGIIVAITAIPFWYTQLLPRPYAEVMFSPTASLQTIADAHDSLRSFPGHADDADRLYRQTLESRALQATDWQTMADVDQYARQLAGPPEFADNLLASYWDRQTRLAMRGEDRERALIGAIESLVESTPMRRRRAATLVGEDYPQLIGTIRATNAQRLAFNPESQLLSFFKDGEVSQWSLANGVIQARAPWTISALEVTPLVRRVVVDRTGTATRVGLTINVSHTRLADLRVRLIAPSGRAAELAFRQTSSAANDVIRFSGEQLATLRGEPLAGTWSLSLRDETTGVAGHLLGWNLSLNSQVIVENFDRGLDIPDPVEKQTGDLWIARDGRYAVARSLQSDGVRLWDLANAQATKTIAVPASENPIGLSTALGLLVTATADKVNLWRTEDGRYAAGLATGPGGQQVRLSQDGRHILVQRRDEADTTFQLWSLETDKILASVSVAGTPALVSIDASGNHLAVADYDRSVRIWDFRSGELRAQFNLVAQPSQVKLSPDGSRLGVVHSDQGVSLWRTDAPGEPLLRERQRTRWQLEFSKSGDKLIAGSNGQGFQVYRSSDGALIGPLLDSALPRDAATFLAFSADEKYILTAATAYASRLWHAPVAAAVVSASSGEPASGHRLWRESGDAISAISPGGRRIAIGDSQGHVHILQVGAAEQVLADADEDISFLGHRAPVIAITFSSDGSMIASAAQDGTIRVWDARSGLPRPYHANASVSVVEQMQFSPNAGRLAISNGQRVWIIAVDDGALLAEIELGEVHAAMAFADEQLLFVGGESGTLRSLTPDRSGSWHLRNVWQGAVPIRRMGISPMRRQLVLVDAVNEARLLDIRSGRVGELVLAMPDEVSDIVFSPSEARVLLRTSRWIHRAALSPAGLAWVDAIRAPKALSGSRMVLDTEPSGTVADRSAISDGDRVLMLTRETGFAEVAELQFSYSAGPALVGNREELIAEWSHRLGLQTAPAVENNPAAPAAQLGE